MIFKIKQRKRKRIKVLTNYGIKRDRATSYILRKNVRKKCLTRKNLLGGV